MSEKVVLPKEVAEAIEFLRKQEISNYGIIALTDQIPMLGRDYSKEVIDALTVIRKFSYYNTEEDAEGEAGVELILQALVNGYAGEETNEDRLREFYKMLDVRPLPMQSIVLETLSILNIKIEGVNT